MAREHLVLSGVIALCAAVLILLTCFAADEYSPIGDKPDPARENNAPAPLSTGEEGVQDASLRSDVSGAVTLSASVLSSATRLPLSAHVRSGTRSLWSRADTGAFTLTDIRSDVLIEAPGYAARSLPLSEVESTTTVLLDPTMAGVVHVRDALDAAIGSASVFQIVSHPSERHALLVELGKSDVSGRIECHLAEWPSWLIARKDEAWSQPTCCSASGGTLICDQGVTGRLRIVTQGGQSFSGKVSLTLACAYPGKQLTFDCGEAGISVPSGSYSISLPDGLSIAGLLSHPSYAGQLLYVSPETEVLLRLKDDGTMSLRVISEQDNSPLASEITLEVLVSNTWEQLGPACPTRIAGFADIAALMKSASSIDRAYWRIRIQALGHDSRIVQSFELSPGMVVKLSPIGDVFSLIFRRDGAPFRGQLVVSLQSSDAIPQLISHDCRATPGALQLVAAAGSQISFLASDKSNSPQVAQPQRLVRGQRHVYIDLFPSATIVVEGASSEMRLCAARSDGDQTHGELDEARITIGGLFPGEYRVGPPTLVALEAHQPVVAECSLAAGEMLVVQASDAWTGQPALSGRIEVLGTGRQNLDSLRVLPWRGAAPRGKPQAYVCGVPVTRDGCFSIGHVDYVPEVLAVYNNVPGCPPMLLGAYPVSDKISLAARRVVLFLKASEAREAKVILVVNGSGGAVPGQWLIPCITQQVLDLGVIPTVVDSCTILSAGRQVDVNLPPDGGVIEVAL